MDFTISGHVNRALIVVDSDDNKSTKAGVRDNGSSGTRIRWTGSSEMMDGNSVGIQVEYGAGSSLSLRHANVYYAGEFGKATIGQGSEAGDGSAYRGSVTTFGIGHGQEMGKDFGFSLADYFGSLDAGGRTENIRYDTPAIGPVGAAVSVGNDDRISLAATLSTEFSGSSFNAMIASLREDNKANGDAQETVGASFGVSMANGLGISGAWAKGDNYGGSKATAGTASDGCIPADDGPVVVPNAENEGGCPSDHSLGLYFKKGDEPKAATHPTDPSFFQAGIAYSFGDTTVSASWYSSEDFANEGSDGTALGIGVNHNMPKVGAQVYAAVQGYSAEDEKAERAGKPLDADETVFVVGTRVRF